MCLLATAPPASSSSAAAAATSIFAASPLCSAQATCAHLQLSLTAKCLGHLTTTGAARALQLPQPFPSDR